MSLNDNVLDDITDTGVDTGNIVPPSELGAPSGTVIAQTHTDTLSPGTQNTDPTKRPSPALIATLPQMKVQFDVITDRSHKLVEMQEVESAILAEESMSRNAAEEVQACFGKFLNNGVALEEFTWSPSKTNFLYTKRFMRNTIAKEQDEVGVLLQNFGDKATQDMKFHLDESCEKLCQLKTTVINFQGKANNASINLETNKDMVMVYKENDFINIVTSPVVKIEVSLVKPADKESANRLLVAINELKTILTNPEFKVLCNFLFACLEQKAAEEIFEDHTTLDSQIVIDSLCVKQLVDLLKSSTVEKYIQAISNQIELTWKSLEDWSVKAGQLSPKDKEVSSFILDTREDYRKCLHRGAMIVALVGQLEPFVKVSQEIVEAV